MPDSGETLTPIETDVYFQRILGHDRPVRVLRRALGADRVPHAYLFWGPDGVGKEQVALATARALLCAQTGPEGEGCGGCSACRKLDAASHPDLHLLSADGASIGVGQVRALQETLSYQAFERGRKVAIIRDAFRLTREGANALLKTLEEPSPGVHLFLLAHHRSQLLPTLVSRCQSIRFDPIPAADVGRLLVARGVTPDLAEAMAEVSGGCPGQVWDEDPELFGQAEEEAEALWEGLEDSGVRERFALAAEWSRDKQKLACRLDTLERVVHGRIRAAAERGAADRAALKFLEALAATRRLLDSNVNTQLALDALFLGIQDRDRMESS